MSDDTISNISKEFAKKIVSVKDAFILEELKPFYTYTSEDGIRWSQKVRLRLAKYNDFKLRFEQEKEELCEKIIEDINKHAFFDMEPCDFCIVRDIIKKDFGVEK